MGTLQEEAHTPANGADGELSALQDAAGEHKIPERRLVDTLLDISEENFLNETEPHEYHCHSGWENAVCGWARVAPLSCILVTSNTNKKPKCKEADNGTPSSDDPTPSNADSSASIAEQRCESCVSLDNFKKFVSVNQQTGSWSESAMEAQQTDATEWPALNAMQRKKTHLLPEEKTDERAMHRGTLSQFHHLSSKYSVSENKPAKPAKPQKYNYRPSNRVVPVKNFTFLPPIKSPHVISKASGYLCRGKKTPEGQTSEKNCFILEKRCETRVDTVANSGLSTFSAALTSKYQTYWQNRHNVSIPRCIEYNVSQT